MLIKINIFIGPKKHDDHQYKLQLKLQHCLQKEVSQEHGRYSINNELIILSNIDK